MKLSNAIALYRAQFHAVLIILLSPVLLPAQPAINDYAPPRNTTATVLGADIVLTWSEAMSTTTLNSDNVRVHGSQTGLYTTNATFSYSSGNTILTVDPAIDFKPGELISVSVTTGIRSSTGAGITSAAVWSFTAAAQGWGVFANTWTGSGFGTTTYKSELVDLDGDGDLDIFEANFGNNRVLLNNGNGAYSAGWEQSSDGTTSVSVAVFDVDGDGDLDVYEGNNNADNKVWKNDGSGNFTNTWTQSGGGTPTLSITYGDVDGDGDLDVFEGNYLSQNNKVWLNDGNGNFTVGWTQSGGATNTLSVVMGDLDGDGDLDVFEGNEYQNSKVWKNDGNGNFSNTWSGGGSTAVQCMSIGDLDGDGDLDVFEGNIGQANMVWVNDGSGSFSTGWTQSGGTNTFGIAMGDVDGDGDLDVFEGSNNAASMVWLNDGSGTYSEGWAANSINSNIYGVTLGDVDGDGDLDMVEGNIGQACRVWSNVPFALTGVAPATNALHVPGTAGISLVFNADVEESTVTSTHVRIAGSQTGLYPASMAYNGGTRTVSVAPGAFKPGELVSVSVTTGIQSSTGLPLNRARVWSFTAAAQGGSGTYQSGWTQSGDSTNTASVVLGDLDSDGDLDVFEGNEGGANKVWKNDGNGNFANTWTQSDGWTNTVSVVLGDLDGDGDLDVFEGNEQEPNKLWENDGSGNFTNTWTQSGSTNTVSVVLGDLDGDGDLDVFEGNEGGANKVWKNDGSGNFTNTWTQSGGTTSTVSVALGDIDGDGDLDLFEGNEQGPNTLWENDGSGNFTNTWTQSSTTNTVSVALGDVDGDGDLDVFEGNAEEPNRLWENDGSGNFANTWTQSDSTNTRSIAIGDVDGDGDLDVFEGNAEGPGRLWENNGRGSFTNTWTQSGTTNTASVVLGDVDGDGDVDVFAGNSARNNTMWRNIPAPVVVSHSPATNALAVAGTAGVSITFSTSMNVSTLTSANIYITGSQTGAYSTSAVLYNSSTNTVTLLPASGFKPGEHISVSITTDVQSSEGALVQTSTVWSFTIASSMASGSLSSSPEIGVGTNPNSVEFGDMNNDGNLDLVVINEGSNTMTVLLGDGTGGFSTSATVSTGAWPVAIELGDMNSDGNLDVIVQGLFDSYIRIIFGNGSGGFFPSSSPVYPNLQYSDIALGDVNGDGKTDLFLVGELSNNVTVLLGSGDGGIYDGTEVSVGTSPKAIALGDVNGDGRLDMVTANAGSSDVSIVLGDGRGRFGAATAMSMDLPPADIALGDVNGDGKLDVVAASPILSHIFVKPGDGSGNFSGGSTMSGSGLVPSNITLGDVNGDGKLDIVGTDKDFGLAMVLLGQGTGSFSIYALLSIAGSPRGAVLGDVNGDGRLDAAVANYNRNSISILTGTAPVPVLTGREPGPNALAVASTAPVELTFSTGMSVSTLTTANIRITGNQTGSYSTSAITYASSTNTVSLLPGSGFKPGELISVSVTTGVQSSEDVRLNNGTVWSFTAAVGQGGTGFLVERWQQSASTATSTQGVALGDLDGDGDVDMVEGNYNQPNKVWKNDGDGNFANTWTQAGGTTNTQSIALGDVDGDGDLDMFEGNYNQLNKVWKNDGNGNFVNTWEPVWGETHTQSVVLGDLDGDGTLDVYEGNENEDNKVWLNNGEGIFTETWTPGSGATDTRSVALGDLDGDGDLDVVEGISGGPNRVWKNGDNWFMFTEGWIQSDSTNTTSIALGDLDGDGDLDMFEGNDQGPGKIWLNDGDGNFTNTWIQSADPTTTTSAALGDLNGDGYIDVFEGNDNEPGRVWMNSRLRVVLQSQSTSATQSGGAVSFGIQLQTEDGTPYTVQQDRTIALTVDHPLQSAPVAMQAAIVAGQQSTTLTVSIYNTTLTPVTTSLTISLVGINSIPTAATLSVGANNPPQISTGATAIEMPEDSATHLTVSVWDVETATSALVISAASNNAELLPGSSIVQVGATGATTSFEVRPATNAHGVVEVLVTVSDGLITSSTSFTITIVPVNDAPGFSTGANLAALDEDGTQTIAPYLSGINAGPDNEAEQSVQFVVSNSNPALFAVQPDISSTGTLSFTPAQGAQGIAVVSVYAQDNGGAAHGGTHTSATQSFTISVGLSPATHLRITGINAPVQSGETLQITVASYTALGTQRSVTAATIVGVLWDTTYLAPLSGSTQAVLSAGSSVATVSIALFSSSTANIEVPVAVEAVGGVPGGTTAGIVVRHAVPGVATATTNNRQATLQWSPPAAQGITGYAIYRRTVSGNLSEIGTSATASYVDNSAVNGTTYYYAVQSVAGSLRSGLSDEVSVTIPLLAITSPNGGELWRAGRSRTITWNTVGTVATVSVEYSLDNGSIWLPIATLVDNTGGIAWPIATTTASTTALVRVYDAFRPGIQDESDAAFSIIEPVAPVTSLSAQALHEAVQLSWSASTTAGVTGYAVYHGTTSGSLSLLATVSADTAAYRHSGLTDGLRRYYALKTLAGSDESVFSREVSVVPTTLQVLWPNGGEQLQAGTQQNLQWQYSGDISSMRVEYSTDNGLSWTAIAQTETLTGNKPLTVLARNWEVANLPTTTALIRVVSLDPVAISDESNAAFTIEAIAPPSSLLATAGSTTITLIWTASTAANILGYRVLRGTTSGSMSEIASVVTTASYTDTGANTCTTYHYAVQTRAGSYLSALSNAANARIVSQENITVLTPNGGENWQAGLTRNITWTSTSCTVPGVVTLEYSIDNGGNWHTIATTANTGGYSWIVPDAASTQAVVRISGNALADQSNGLFSIAPIPAPTALTADAGDGSVQLHWTPSTAAGVTMQYVYRGTTGGSLSLLDAVSSTAASYTDNNVTNCTLYIYGVAATAGGFYSAVSNEASAIPQMPSAVVVSTPNGGEQWRMHLPYTITWMSTGCSVPATVAIEVSPDNGGSWTNVTHATANTGSYIWIPVGLEPSPQVLLRISGDGLSDQSDAVFELLPKPSPSVVAGPVATSASYCSGSAVPDMGTVLSLSDDVFSATTLVVEVATSNPALLPVSGIVQTSPTGATTSFAFVPVHHAAGTAEVVFTVRNAVQSTVTTTVSVSVVAHDPPSVEIMGSTGACAGVGGYTYSVPGEAESYVWTITGGTVTNGAGTQEIIVQWSTAGIGSVSVLVQNANGCTAGAIKNVAVYATPVPGIEADGPTAFCAGGSVQLTAAPGTGYLWSNGATTQSIVVAHGGVYSVEVTNHYGCTAVSTSVNVTVHPAVTAHAGAHGGTTVCSGGSVQLAGGGESSAGGRLTFLWSPATGLDNAHIVNPIATPDTTTTYTLLVTNDNGCSSTASVTLTVAPAPVTTISSTATICAGESTQLLATGGVSYSWSPAAGLSDPNIADPTAGPATTTTYTVAIISADGCSSTASVTVIVQPVVIHATVLLEGAYAGGAMHSHLQSQGVLPYNQPYNTAPFHYTGTEVLGVTSGTAIADWVLMDIRSGTDAGSLVERRAGLLQSDGSITAGDGGAMVYTSLNATQSYYIVVWHRNHAGVMTSLPVSADAGCAYVYNFTGSPTAAYMQFADGQKQIGAGVYGMVAGDATMDGVSNAADRVAIRNASGLLGYLAEDISLDGIVNAVDRVMARNNVFWISQVP